MGAWGRGRRVGAWAAVLVVLGAVAGLAWWWLGRGGEPLARGRSAYARGDWEAAGAAARIRLAERPEDLEAIRLLARAEARQGRDVEALARFDRLGPGRLEAEDLYLIGAGLLRRQRTALALAVLAAAQARDPDHRGVLQAMSEAADRPDRLAEAAELEGRLDAVPSPEARIELMIGLARAGQVATDRLLRRDLASLRSPAAADKLLARALLESGRPTEARERLRDVPASDREAAWLLARAYLQEGDADGSESALARAHGYTPGDRLTPEPAPFVGAGRCAACHGAIARAVRSSRHAATLHVAPAIAGAPLPRGPIADPAEPRVRHVVRREGETIRAEAHVGPEVYGARIAYVLGSDHRGATMVGHDDRGEARELRISHYQADGGLWDLTGGFPARPLDDREYLGRPLTPEGLVTCLHCHATDGRAVRDRRAPAALDRGIGCERCHGPGAHHLRAVELGLDDPAIANARGADAARRVALCAQCHRATEPTEAGDLAGAVRFQADALVQSRCYQASGRLDCMTCHDPHRDAETDASFYVGKCLDCHGPGAPDRVACPVNPKGDCVRCHMPRVADPEMHTEYRDHQIRKPRRPS